MRPGSRAAGTVATYVAIAVIVPALPAWAATCMGRTATIEGTGGRDRIRGTPGNDVVAAGDGSDLVRGRGGDDRICGGGGADLLRGQAGRDQIEGSRGSDILEGGAGRDRLQAGPGFDFLDGGNGGDALSGGGGSTDLLRGRSGNDEIRGGGGFDILIGDAGNDLLHGGSGRVDLATFVRSTTGVNVNLTSGRASGEGDDRVVAVEDIEGTRFNDVLIGAASHNFIVALGGDDVVDGLDGVDQILFLNSASPVTLDLATGTATGEGNDQLAGIDGAYGSPFDDQLSGNDVSNSLIGFEGNDVVLGWGADDFLDGDMGADDGDGGDGADVCVRFENGAPPPNCESTDAPPQFRGLRWGLRAPESDLLDTIHQMIV